MGISKSKTLAFQKTKLGIIKKMKKKKKTPVSFTPCKPSDQVIPKIMGFMRPKAHYFENTEGLGCNPTQKYLYLPLV